MTADNVDNIGNVDNVDNVDDVDNVKQEDFDKLYALPSLWEERTECPQLVTAFPPFFWQLKQEQIIQDNFMRLKRRAADKTKCTWCVWFN